MGAAVVKAFYIVGTERKGWGLAASDFPSSSSSSSSSSSVAVSAIPDSAGNTSTDASPTRDDAHSPDAYYFIAANGMTVYINGKIPTRLDGFITETTTVTVSPLPFVNGQDINTLGTSGTKTTSIITPRPTASSTVSMPSPRPCVHVPTHTPFTPSGLRGWNETTGLAKTVSLGVSAAASQSMTIFRTGPPIAVTRTVQFVNQTRTATDSVSPRSRSSTLRTIPGTLLGTNAVIDIGGQDVRRISAMSSELTC